MSLREKHAWIAASPFGLLAMTIDRDLSLRGANATWQSIIRNDEKLSLFTK